MTRPVLKLPAPRLTLPAAFKQFNVKTETQNKLKNAGVENLNQLRVRFYSDKQFLKGFSKEELEKLRIVTVVSLLSDNEALNKGLVKKGISSINGLARLSVKDLIDASDGKITQDEAEAYKARARALQNVVSAKNWSVRRALSNPTALYGTVEIGPEIKLEIIKGMQGPEPPCAFECNEENNIFSPAVYVLYLLDFITKSFDERLDSLDEIDRRFLQSFGALPLSQQVEKQDSYVSYTNVILENLIAAADPADNLNNNLYKVTTESGRLPEREKIYSRFTDNQYRNEPGFSSGVLGRLFESYVRELGTTRSEVRFVLGGSNNIQARFAEQHHVAISDLAKLGGPADLSNTSLKQLADVKAVIGESLRRQEEKSLKEQFVTEITDLTEREFQKSYRERREAAVNDSLTSLMTILEGDPNNYPDGFDRAVFEPLHMGPGASDESRDAYDRALLAARDAARECVYTGNLCPGTSPWKDKPINFIKELFRAYPQYIPAEYKPTGAVSDLAEAAFENLGEIRAVEHCSNLEEGGGGASSRLALLLKEEDKWKTEYETNPPTCNSLAQEGNLPDRSLQFAKDRLYEADGLEQELQLGNVALGRFLEDLGDAENARAFQKQVDRLTSESLETALSRAEQGYLEQLRTNLVAMALWKLREYYRLHPAAIKKFAIEENHFGGSVVLGVPENIRRLGDYLFADLSVDQTQRTTPLSFAISRIHAFVQAARLGTLTDESPRDFDEETWRWLGSFGTWHAQMMVTAYPSNFLIPEIRQNKTEQFEGLLGAIDFDATRLDDHYSRYKGEVESFKYLDFVDSFSTKDGIFLIAKIPAAGTPGAVYYTVLANDEPWNGWHMLARDKSMITAVVSKNFSAYDDPVFFYRDGYLHVFRIVGNAPPSRTGNDAPYCFDLPKTPRNLKLLHVSYAVEGTKIKSGLDVLDEGTTSDGVPWEELEVEIPIPAETFIGGAELAVDSFGAYIVPRYVGARNTCPDWKNPGNYFFTKLTFEGGAVSGDSEVSQFEDATLTRNIVDIRQRSGIAPLFVAGGYAGNVMKAWARNITQVATSMGNQLVNMTSSAPDFQATGSLLGGFLILAQYTQSGRDPQLVRDLVKDQTATGYAKVTHYKNSSGHSLIDIEYAVPTGPMKQKTIRLDDTSLFKIEFEYGLNRIIGIGVAADGVFSSSNAYEYGSLLAHDLHKQTKNTLNLWRSGYSSYSAGDDARLYLDELGFHAPYAISLKLNEDQRYEEAMQWLQRVYDPLRTTEEEKRVFDGLSESALGTSAVGAVGQWLERPFDPFALADLDRRSYLIRVKLAHVENVLDWADRLFTLDTSESVNRARELYELAARILELHDWPQSNCDLQRFAFRKAIKEASGTTGSRAYVGEWLGSADPTEIGNFRKVLARKACPPLKNAAFRELARASKGDVLESLLSRQAHADRDVIEGLALGDEELLAAANSALGSVDIGEQIPGVMEFCLPMNPLLPYYRWRIESNLDKIRTNRNFAGIQRNLQPYATPVDPAKLVKQAATGGIDYEEFIPSGPPPIYRYTFLRERGKYLVSLAQQFENSMLAALEKEQQASYDLFKARQDLRLERANVTLQSLRVTEARDSMKLADLQSAKAEYQQGHFQELIDQGNLGWEDWSLNFMYAAAGLQFAAGGAYTGLAIGAASTGVGAGKAVEYGAQAASALGSGFSTLASSFSTLASYERRKQEWEYQRDLAQYDLDIANVGITLAEDRVDIVSQEKSIAELRKQIAEDTIELLGNRTLNAELYRWMNRNLQRLYREHLNMAIATAKAAQLALEFERQRSLDFIGFDYWDEDREGLLGAEKLLADIEKMEQFRITTDVRKKELEKTISLSSVAPAEFQRFRETGSMTFETQEAWFDRDFPGHYLRLIRDVRVSTIAVVPPAEGIHATLSNPGISRAMVGAPFEEYSVIYRLPESIAISGSQNATGLFELSPGDPMFLPFEGSGVATTWQLDMPKGANRFDFSTIFDVYLTIRYSALEDAGFRKKVLEKMGKDEEGFVSVDNLRYFSVRNEFPDAWYAFHNPTKGLADEEYADPASDDYDAMGGKPVKPYLIVLDIENADFLANEERRKIRRLTIALAKSQRSAFTDTSLRLKLMFLPTGGQWGIDEVESSIGFTADGNEASTVDFNGRNPSGRWILTVVKDDGSPVENAFDPSWLQDLLLIVEYRGKAHYGN